MDFKKYGIVYFLVFIVLVLGVAVLVVRPQPVVEEPVSSGRPASASASLSPVSAVTVVVDFGDDVQTFSGIEADTAYAALVTALKQAAIPYSFKQYSFGILVDKIGDKANNADRAWIYFVNGNSGDVAAEQKHLNPGDKVEWKYIQPS